MINILLGVLEHGFFFSVSYMGWNGIIFPIDELHHFSRWLLHHQPAIFFSFILTIFIGGMVTILIIINH